MNIIQFQVTELGQVYILVEDESGVKHLYQGEINHVTDDETKKEICNLVELIL